MTAKNDDTLDRDLKVQKRNLLIALALIIVIAITFSVCYFFSKETQKNAAVQQTQVVSEAQTSGREQVDEEEEKEKNKNKKTSLVPDLASLQGKTFAEAKEAIGHGAQVEGEQKASEDENDKSRTVRLTLANDESDSNVGNPTVTVKTDGEDKVVESTYDASIKSLGYGTLSFRDAVLNEKIITNVMDEAGVKINDADVNLPSDKTQYSTFTSDSQRISKEQYTFSGVGEKTDADARYKWSATLTYDYANSLGSDNLADTSRTITITVANQ